MRLCHKELFFKVSKNHLSEFKYTCKRAMASSDILKPSASPWSLIPPKVLPNEPLSETLTALSSTSRFIEDCFNHKCLLETQIENRVQNSFVRSNSLPSDGLLDSLIVLFHDVSQENSLTLENMDKFTIYHVSASDDENTVRAHAVWTTLSEIQQFHRSYQKTFVLNKNSIDTFVLTDVGTDFLLSSNNSLPVRFRVWSSNNGIWRDQWIEATNITTSETTMRVLSLEAADKIATIAVETARRFNLPPISVIVSDPHGEIIVSKRMDGCTPAFPKFAYAKAWTATCFKMPSRTFRDKYAPPGPIHSADKVSQMLSMVNITNGQLAPFPGGVVIRAVDAEGVSGPILAGVGVSGASGDEDEFCALAAVHESAIVGVITEPESHSCHHMRDMYQSYLDAKKY